MESGVTWLPAYLWRLTKFWKGLRSEIPWVSDPPGSHRARPGAPDAAAVRRAAATPAAVMRLMEHIGSDEMLLFSTDYPHWQFDGLGGHAGRAGPGPGAENHGGEPAANLCSTATDTRPGSDPSAETVA